MPPRAAKTEAYLVDLCGDFTIALNVDQTQASRWAHYIAGQRGFTGLLNMTGPLNMPKPGKIKVQSHRHSRNGSSTGTFEFLDVEVQATSEENAIDIAKGQLRYFFRNNACIQPTLIFI